MRARQPLSNQLDAARGSSLAHIKSQQLAREDDERVRLRRVCGVLVLIEQFLLEQGYVHALHALQQESSVSLDTYRVADNVDLLSIVDEYEHYYEYKYKRKPALFRVRASSEAVVEGGDGGEREHSVQRRRRASCMQTSSPPPLHQLTHNANGSNADTSDATTQRSYAVVAASAGGDKHGDVAPVPSPTVERVRVAGLLPSPPPTATAAAALTTLPSHVHRASVHRTRVLSKGGNADRNGMSPTLTTAPSAATAPPRISIEAQRLCVGGTATETTSPGVDTCASGGDGVNDVRGVVRGRALRPLPYFATSELSDLAATILREIVDVDPAVHWSDVAELDNAKHLLKEAVVMPVRYPELFEGVVRPWKGILLFGPPGTGKTMLAKAVATECRTTFFNISASSVVSKWRGDSEKLVRMLFDLAVHYAPSTIFIDEIDSLMSARSSDGEHEGSRRMKTELLTQMDGLSKRRGGDVVFVMAASNVPWDLDTAMLRRLEKRVLVSLPTTRARAAMFRRLLAHRVDAPATFDWDACAAQTAGMSGADIDIISREALMRPIRKLIAQLESMNVANNGSGRGGGGGGGSGATRTVVPYVTLEDIAASIACTRSSVQQADLPRFNRWAEQYASGLST